MSTPTQPSLNAIDEERSMFVVEGKSVLFTFCLVSSLFLLWGLLNGMIDVMDKHFQNELNLSLGESAWVQFAHWIGYFLMSLPAGWLATRLGYRIGIVTGLLLVAAGGFWFIPAASVYKAFWAFLLGVCVVAAGLAFLETVANPYTTVLGPKRWSATRINIAQSCNGVGWLLGPFVGGLFFYGEHPKLWIPYATVAVVVLVLAGIFSIAPMPDVKAKDDYSIDENADPDAAPQSIRKVNRGLSYVLLLGCLTALVGVFGMISWLILNSLDAGQRLMGFASKLPRPEGFPITAESALLITIIFAGCVVIAIGAMWLIAVTKRLTHHSIWSHEHFTGAVLAQFFYVAAQAGIFSFLINYMTSQVPPIPASWNVELLGKWFETAKDGTLAFSNQGASNLASLGFICFLIGRFTGAGLLSRFSAHKVLGLYAVLNVVACALVFLKLGWISVACVFLSYFFMSIMFPTIFALGIFGLGLRAKKASAFIVMAIMGGAILPKLMGHVADVYDMSRAFIVPLACFGLVAVYGLLWPWFSKADSLQGLSTTGGH